MDAIVAKIGAMPEAKCVVELVALATGCEAKTDMPSREKRKRLLGLFEAALSSGKPKLAFAAVEGFQMLLHEPDFSSDDDATKDEERTACQAIAALRSMPSWDRAAKCQALPLLVQTISTPTLKVILSDVYAAMQVASAVYAATDDASVRMAVRAAITQLLNSFCGNRYAAVVAESQEEIVVLMDMTELIKELLTRIDMGQQTNPDDLQLGVDALSSALAVQPAHFHRHQPLLNVFITELIPSLLCLLQIAGERTEKSKSFLERARSSTSKKSSQRGTILTSSDTARSFYQLVESVIRLMTPLPASREQTVELFRSALVVPPPDRRHEALRFLKRFCTAPTLLECLLNLMVLHDLTWLVIIECLEESAKQTTCQEVGVEAVRTLQVMFDAFESVASRSERLNLSCEFFARVKAKNDSDADADFVKRPQIPEDASELPVADQVTQKLAKKFVNDLQSVLPVWLAATSPRALDSEFQLFAANFASGIEAKILNCDAAYLCVFAALSTALRNHQAVEQPALFVSRRILRRDFLIAAACEGCIVYADESWLGAVYASLDAIDLFAGATLDGSSVLEGLVEDYDGWHKRLLIYQPQRSETRAEPDEDVAPVLVEERVIRSSELQQVDTWMHRLLSNSWATVQAVLSRFPLKLEKKSASTEGAEATLEAMKSFSRILRSFAMEREVLWLYEKFAEEVCNLEDLREFVATAGNKPWPVTGVDASGLRLVLDSALLAGSLSPGCWKHVVRVVEYVAELERHQFALTKSAHTSYETEGSGLQGSAGPGGSELSLKAIGKLLDDLMLKTHAFFENAARQLALPALCRLIDALVAANEANLKYTERCRVSEGCNLVQRVGRLLAQTSGRPLVHSMKAWGRAVLHLAECSTARFPEEVTRLAIAALADAVRALLLPAEPTGFCFHQALFGSFQGLLCSDACAEETQEHILSVLCSFVEDKPHQVASGWKPLFGCLKAIRIANSRAKDPRVVSVVHFAVLDVLKRYFAINDAVVLVPTALEFIGCVSHYLQATARAEGEDDQDAAIEETIFSFVPLAEELFTDYLASGEACASQQLLARLRRREGSTNAVEEPLPKYSQLSDVASQLREVETFGVYPKDLEQPLIVPAPPEPFPWSRLDSSQQSVVELALTLIESLAALVLTCPRHLHSKVVTNLADFIGGFRSNAFGPDLGAFCLCSLIFPTYQKWVRHTSAAGFHLTAEAARSVRSLKQAAGILTQVVVEYVTDRPEAPWSVRLLIDCYNVLHDFVAHPSQAISGIGTACLKHLILSAAERFNEALWHVTTVSLWRANAITLAPIRRLCLHYFTESTDCVGDIGKVVVGVRRDEADRDNPELAATARQVFCVETSQPGDESVPLTPVGTALVSAVAAPQPAYVLELTSDSVVESMSLEDVVISCLNNQVLIQLIAAVLLDEASAATVLGRLAPRTPGPKLRPPPKALGGLFAVLDAAAVVAAGFDDRPALKGLLQRLCGLEAAANLYKCQIAVQSVKLMALYDVARDGGHVEELAKGFGTILGDLKKYDALAAANKLSSFARDRLDRKIQIQLAEASGDKTDALKRFAVVSTNKCLEEYKKQKRTETLPSTARPTNRVNPFVSTQHSQDATVPATLPSADQLQLSQLGDLDVRILSLTEVIALALERFVADTPEAFERLLPALCPIIVDFLRVGSSLRARSCVSDFIARLTALRLR